MASTPQTDFETALRAAQHSIERTLDGLVQQSVSARLLEAARYAALGAGKRLRPFLVLQSASLFDASEASALRVGAALECVHCYSLVHDDLPAMDDDDLRRGKPTTHRKFDEATAILAGDALLTLAFQILADDATHPDPEVRCQLVLELAKAAGLEGMAGGQMLDIEAETSKSQAMDIMQIQRHKTGALFRFACESGAILAKQPRASLRQYADDIGLAFQITDDLLDETSSPEQLGKATQKDKKQGKATLATALGTDIAQEKVQQLVNSAIQSLSVYAAKADMLRNVANYILVRRK